MTNNVKPAHDDEFGPIRKAIWPIHNYELKKFLPLGLIMFCILFNYTLLRDTKDSLVVNAAGASVISFLKLYCVTPSAILFVIFYAKLTNILSKEKVFYAVVTPFLVFFAAFAFIIYPNVDALHLEPAKVASLHQAYPALSGFIDIIAYWSYSLFYVLSEIWGSAMIALMFWQFANQVVRMNESKRFYGLFVVIGNVALIFSGLAVAFFSENIKDFFPGESSEYIWTVSLQILMSLVVAMGVGAMALYRWMHVAVLTDPLYYEPAESGSKTKKKKKKPGLAESFKMIISSPELGLIAVLIMAYGVTINLVEVQWKGQLKTYFAGDKGGYNGFMGLYSTWTGIVTIFFSLFLGSNILRKLSWVKAAIITPSFIFIAGLTFFAFVLSTDIALLKEYVISILSGIGTNPIAAATFLGAALVLFSKAIKYSLFDPTKEMAYIPLNEEQKTKGKAAVDVIGGRAGKAGGAFIQSTLLALFATKDVLVIAPVTLMFFTVACILWFVAVKKLGSILDVTIASKKKSEKAKSVVGNSTAQPA